MKTPQTVTLCAALLLTTSTLAQWQGFSDQSAALNTNAFTFAGSPGPEAYDSNQNYYDGDFADVDGDGLNDRGLLARFGLLLNTGGGRMTPFTKGLSGYDFNFAIGNDAVQFADVDNDGDYDSIQGGNGEPLVLQINRKGRFSIKWSKNGSALYIVNTDLERDGDVDLIVAHAFCRISPCGGPIEFSLWVNDGQGNYTEAAVARGLPYTTNNIVATASGDIDGDGDFDILISHGNNGNTVVAKNNGSGFFTTATAPIGVSGSGFGQTMSLGDIDDDGDLDVLVTNAVNSSLPNAYIDIGINDGTGTFTNETVARLPPGGFPSAIDNIGRWIDVDYDNDLDIFLNEITTTTKRTRILLNDGTGNFVYSAALSMTLPNRLGAALGQEVDVSDLDGNGTYDFWIGLGGDDVSILLNSYVSPDGIPADVPRNVAVTASGPTGVTLRWSPPPFAATARYYRVYRSTRAGLHMNDRQLIKVVGPSRHQDEGFSAPLSRHTTAAQLGDASVTLDGANNRLSFTDTAAIPGIRYHYSVVHVGTENEASEPSAEVSGMVPATSGATDTTAPSLEIISPSPQDWGAHPRIVLHLGDGQSGIDPTSLHVSFDRPIGSRASGANLADLNISSDGKAFVAALPASLGLPFNTLVTLTVRVSDQAGNTTQKQLSFFVSVVSATPPTASFTQSANAGSAPIAVAFDATASADTGGKVVGWEWYFSDGVTLLGRQISRTFAYGGNYTVTLRVRDNEGGVATSSSSVNLTGSPPPPDDPADGGELVRSVLGCSCNAVGAPTVLGLIAFVVALGRRRGRD